MLVCPGISETTLALTSLISSSVAQVWRISWKRMVGSPAFSSSGAKKRHGFLTERLKIASGDHPRKVNDPGDVRAAPTGQ